MANLAVVLGEELHARDCTTTCCAVAFSAVSALILSACWQLKWQKHFGCNFASHHSPTVQPAHRSSGTTSKQGFSRATTSKALAISLRRPSVAEVPEPAQASRPTSAFTARNLTVWKLWQRAFQRRSRRSRSQIYRLQIIDRGVVRLLARPAVLCAFSRSCRLTQTPAAT